MALRRFSTSGLSGTKSSKVWDGETFPGYFESIATVIVPSGGSANVTFSNIPNTYTHLQVRWIARDTGTPANVDNTYMQINADTGSNYSYHRLTGNGSTASANASTTQSNLKVGFQGNAGNTANAFGVGILDILDYTNSDKYKTIRSLAGTDLNDTNGSITLHSGLWTSKSVITSIKLYPEANNFDQYSHFALYGIRSA